MPGRWIALGLVGFILVHTRGVRAQASPDPGNDRRGLYIRIGGGPGYSSGDYRFSDMSHPAFQPTTLLTFETTLHGAHGEFAGAVGHAVAPGLAVAGSGTVRIVPVPSSSERLAESEIGPTLVANLGLIVDFYPLPLEETHFVAGAGWATGSFLYSNNDIASPDNIVAPEPVSGPHAQAGAGYRLAARFDLLVSASYAWLESTHSEYRPLGVTVLASYVLF